MVMVFFKNGRFARVPRATHVRQYLAGLAPSEPDFLTKAEELVCEAEDGTVLGRFQTAEVIGWTVSQTHVVTPRHDGWRRTAA